MKTNSSRLGLIGGLLVWGIVLTSQMANAVLTTNYWRVNSAKWETGPWTAGAPSLDDAVNIIPNSQPTGGGTVTIDATTSGSFPGTMTISNLMVQGDLNSSASYTLSLNNAGTTTPLRVRNTFTISTDGALFMNNSFLHVEGHFIDNFQATCTNGLLVTTNAAMSTTIGSAGTGTFTIRDSTWLSRHVNVGILGHGTLTIVGGTSRFSGVFEMGLEGGATGTVWLTGGEIAVTNDASLVGQKGTGRLTVSNGTWLARHVTVGAGTGGNGTVTLAGGSISVSEDLLVGSGAVWLTDGSLKVTNGNTQISFGTSGQMTVSNGTWLGRAAVVALSAGSRGTLTAAGGASSIYSNLTIGRSDCASTGIVNLTSGELRVTNNTGTAVLEVCSGTLTQSGGTLQIDRLVITNPCAWFVHTGGTLIVGVTNLNAFAVADGDVIWNSWEQAAGLDPFNPNDAASDDDGDGKSNLEEFFTDTNPHDANKYLRITSIVRTNNDIRISWPTEEFFGLGIFYRVLAGTNLLAGITNNLSGNIFAGPTGSTNYLDVGGATNVPPRFYRVFGNID